MDFSEGSIDQKHLFGIRRTLETCRVPGKHSAVLDTPLYVSLDFSSN